MAKFIVKIAPDQDAYVYWDDQADVPLFGGTKAQLTQFFIANYKLMTVFLIAQKSKAPGHQAVDSPS